MSVDWSKYPTLPQAPELPEWRDTPEHEAYWKEVEDIRVKSPSKSVKVIENGDFRGLGSFQAGRVCDKKCVLEVAFCKFSAGTGLQVFFKCTGFFFTVKGDCRLNTPRFEF